MVEIDSVPIDCAVRCPVPTRSDAVVPPATSQRAPAGCTLTTRCGVRCPGVIRKSDSKGTSLLEIELSRVDAEAIEVSCTGVCGDGILDLHILNASGRLTPLVGVLRERMESAFSNAAGLLELGGEQVDVVVRDAPAQTIPEIGIGAVAPDSYTMFLALDPLHPAFRRSVDGELAQTVAHELHHIARRRAGCRGRTLWDAVIHEGFADHFSVEVSGSEPPPWSLAVASPTLDGLLSAIAGYGDGRFDHAVWFYGSEPQRVPRWAGYAVGWHVVARYLERHPGLRPSQLAGRPADAFR